MGIEFNIEYATISLSNVWEADMSEQKRYEKDEKDEKEVDKQEEKNVEEKWRRDPLGSMIWALILIWAGAIWLAWNFGVLERYAFLNRILTVDNDINPPIWRLILLGAGILIAIEIVIRLVVPAYRRSVIGSVIIAAIFIGIGLGQMIHWTIIWPVVIILVGVILILQGVFRKK
jgi:hypothetical protein